MYVKCLCWMWNPCSWNHSYKAWLNISCCCSPKLYTRPFPFLSGRINEWQWVLFLPTNTFKVDCALLKALNTVEWAIVCCNSIWFCKNPKVIVWEVEPTDLATDWSEHGAYNQAKVMGSSLKSWTKWSLWSLPAQNIVCVGFCVILSHIL